MVGRPLKILLLAPTSVVGGIATWTRYLLRNYNQDKLDIRVIDNAKRYEEIGKNPNPRGVSLGILNSFTLLFRIVSKTLRERPALIYLTCSGYWSFFTRDLLFVLVSRLLGLKTLIHLRGGHIEAFCGHSTITRWLARRAMSFSHRVIVVSREMEMYIHPFFPERTVYLPNMLENEVLERAPFPRSHMKGGRIKALHMAWQSPAKGSYDIIKACALIRDRLPGFSCDLVGKAAPEHAAEIRRMILDAGLGEVVQLRDEATGDEKWKYFSEADIFLFPSHSEGFPNVILEAMSYGLPIIASNVGNIREMVGWNTGEEAALVLEGIDPISCTELAEAILHLASNPSTVEKLSMNGRKRVRERYLVGTVVPQIEQLILDTAKEI